MGEMDDGAVEALRMHCASRTAGIPVRPEHEMVDEKLRAAGEEIAQRLLPRLGVEDVVLVDAHPGQLPAPACQLVALPRMRLLRMEQLEPRRQPFFPRSGPVLRHRFSPAVLRPLVRAGT